MASSRSYLLTLCCSIGIVLAADSLDDLAELRRTYPPHSQVDTNGKFLRIVMLNLPPIVNITRNATGHITEIKGVAVPVIEWLSVALNFTYVLLPDNIYSVEDNAAGKGLMSRVVEGKADLILGGVVMTASRFKYLNFPFPFVIGQFGLIIPMPGAQVNIAAILKPFQQEVWIFFGVSFLATVACLYGISNGIAALYPEQKSEQKVYKIREKLYEDVGHAWQYVIGVVFSQSILAQRETNRNQKLTIRLLAGAWCITCFVLVTAYASILISFVASPYYKPLIDSLYDFPKNPKVKITVDRGWSPDLLFTSAENGIFQYLGDQLRKDPSLRCSTTDQCLDKVRTGPYAYTQEYRTLKNFIGNDLKRVGRCDLTIAKELYLSFGAGLALPKHVDIEFYTRGMLKAHGGGFVNLWFDRNVADASRCLSPLRSQSSAKIRLGLSGLSGAFVVLALGYCLSLFVFVSENIYKLRCQL